MPHLPKVVLCFVLAAVVMVSPVWAKKKMMNPVPPDIAPTWTPVPQVPGVAYAPNIPADLFLYGGSYYYYQDGIWSMGRAINGPLQQITNLPPVFYQIQAPYFKSPPGWARGKKTGWRGAPLPPGQMKKYEGGALPPGQMKKY